MEWRQDIRPARTGDAEAVDRLKEYLTPFVHGVCLAHAPHHVTATLVDRVLTTALATLGGVEDVDLGSHVISVARRMAKEASPGTPHELPSADVGTAEALRVISRLREINELAREHFFLRMLEGVPGPEIADVARLTAGDLRAELERAAADAARLLGQGQSFAGDDYLWDLSGAPGPLLARLEMQLPVLRHDPSVTAPGVIGVAAPDTAGTHVELAPVGSGLGAPSSSPSSRVSTSIKKLVFDEKETTSVGEVNTEPGVLTVAPPKPVNPKLAAELAAANPFEPQVRTIAATDLPAEARGSIPAPQVPWDDPGPSSKSGRMGQLPARPVPQVKEGEQSGRSVSGKSNSGKRTGASGNQQPASSGSGKFGMPSTVEVTKDAPKLTTPQMPEITDPKAPPIKPLATPAIAGSGPESLLGRPTMEISLAQAVQGETRINPIPVGAITNEETRVHGVIHGPPPTWKDGSWFKGATPLYVSAALTLVGALIWGATVAATERQAKSSWQLTEVVVAAEDLNVGDVVTLENVALRAVPEPYKGANVIKGDAMDFILDQKMAVAVQAGDPLFYSQFVSMRASRGLATRLMKRGRAYTIATSTTRSVGQWVKPGDSVDLIVTMVGADPRRKGKKVEPQPISFTVLQHVHVLATGKADDDLTEVTLDERDKAYGDVTLLLTAPEAEIVALAASIGKITLTLRAGDDDDVELESNRGFTTIQTLLEGDRVKLLQKKRFAIIKSIRNNSPEAKKP
ncbi:MAG: Flp pilus assembly protein CpaB [Archangium sp.]